MIHPAYDENENENDNDNDNDYEYDKENERHINTYIFKMKEGKVHNTVSSFSISFIIFNSIYLCS